MILRQIAILVLGTFPFFVKAEELYLKNYKITIMDGDTIKAGEHRLRMLYIDAPESTQKCKTVQGDVWACGKKSTEYLKKLVGTGQYVMCKIKGQDMFKRSLAHCFIGDIDINQEMVRSGYAIAYVKYGSPYINKQKEAMMGLAGIWSGTFIEPEIYRKLKKAPRKDMAKKFKEKLDL